MRAVGALPRPLQERLAGDPIEIDGQRLDPEVQIALRALEGRGGYEERPPATSRRDIEREARRFRGRRVRVEEVRELSVPGAEGRRPARLYCSRSPSGALIVYLHGGGWVEGSLDSHEQTCRFLARETAARVIAVDYRRAPEDPFPAGLEDAAAALRWAREHAADLGADRRRIAIAGDSAGGNLAAVLARETAQRGEGPAMQALIYPVCDLAEKRRSYRLFGEGFFLTEGKMDWYRDNYLLDRSEASNPRVSPLLADDLSGLPPAYVAIAGFDPLRDEGLAYVERLREAGVPTELGLHRGLVHGFANAVGVGRVSAAAMRRLAAALRAGLAASPSAP